MKSILTLGFGSLSGYSCLNGFGDADALSTSEQAVTQLLQAVSRSYVDVLDLVRIQGAKTVVDASVAAVQKTAGQQLASAVALHADSVKMLSDLILSNSTPGAGDAIQAFLAEVAGIEATRDQVFEGAKGMVAAEKALMNASIANWKKNGDVGFGADRKLLTPAQQFSVSITYYLMNIAWAAKAIWGGEAVQSEGQQDLVDHKNNVYSVISTLSKGIDPQKAASLYQSGEGLHTAAKSIGTVMTAATNKAYSVLAAAKGLNTPTGTSSPSAATAAANKAAAAAAAAGATPAQQQAAAAAAYAAAGGNTVVPAVSPVVPIVNQAGLSTPVMIGIGVALLGVTFVGVRALKKAKAAKASGPKPAGPTATGVGCLECGL